MSAPAYLEGLPRAKRRRPWLLLALWAVLVAVFTAFLLLLPRAPVDPDGYAETAPARDTLAAILTSSPWLFAGAVAAVFVATVTLAFALLLRSQRRVMAPLRKARLAMAQGDPGLAVDTLRDAIRVQRGPGVRSALFFALAQVASERGHFAEALQILDEAEAALGSKATRSNRESSDYRVNVRMARADALLALGRFDEAAAELTPLPPAWMPLAHAYAIALSIRLAAGRRDHAATLRLLRDHAVSNERRLNLRERWLLRTIEHLARGGHVPVDALPDDPSLREWIAARVPGADVTINALGGVA